MKGSIASLLTALDALRQTRTKPLMNVEVSFTADEETDSFLGARWIVDEAPINPDYAIVMEGGEGDEVCCGHNGTLWLEVTVHGARPTARGRRTASTPSRRWRPWSSSSSAYKKQIARTTFVTPEGKTMRPTINVGGVFSCGPGAKINTVPAQASFSIDRRVLAVENHAAAERDLRAFLAAAARRIPGCRITRREGLGELLLLHEAEPSLLQGHGLEREDASAGSRRCSTSRPASTTSIISPST